MAAPQDLQRLVTEVDGWLDLRCPDKALERLQPLLERPSTRTEALVLRVRAYAGLKRWEKALVDIAELRATTHDPDWLDLTEAWCKRRTGDVPAAIACVRRLLERNRTHAKAHFNLGCYLALTGETEQALAEVTLACGLEEDYRHELLAEPDLEPLYKDPRFRELAKAGDGTGDGDGDGEDEFGDDADDLIEDPD